MPALSQKITQTDCTERMCQARLAGNRESNWANEFLARALSCNYTLTCLTILLPLNPALFQERCDAAVAAALSSTIHWSIGPNAPKRGGTQAADTHTHTQGKFIYFFTHLQTFTLVVSCSLAVLFSQNTSYFEEDVLKPILLNCFSEDFHLDCLSNQPGK